MNQTRSTYFTHREMIIFGMFHMAFKNELQSHETSHGNGCTHRRMIDLGEFHMTIERKN